jgi:hypothetical protein
MATPESAKESLIKQPLEVRAVGEFLIFAVFVFFTEALAARQAS